MWPLSSASAMKTSGADRPALGVHPARQRLEAAQPVRRQVVQRLVDQRQLALADGAAQVALELELLGDALVHALVEQHDAAAAVGLGGVHRQVGVAQHLVGGAVAEVAERDADAGARQHLGAVDHASAPTPPPAGAAASAMRVVGVVHLLQQHGELVAAQPRHQVARAHAVGQAARHLAQQRVAGDVAEAVVDDLEAVEVEEHHREARASRPARVRSTATSSRSLKQLRLARSVRLSW